MTESLSATEASAPRPLAPARWNWSEVRRVLVVRLRSIGDTVLATPSLHALRRFLPDAGIDVLLEDWVAPVLKGFDEVSNIITLERNSSTTARAQLARKLRARDYDVAYNLHGGTTATLLVRATGARHRVGYKSYQYSRLYNHAAPSALEIWGQAKTHSVEQQLALLGWTGVPVSDRPPTRLVVTPEAAERVAERLHAAQFDETKPFALFHTAAAYETKRWATENFARVAEHLHTCGISSVALLAEHEAHLGHELKKESRALVTAFTGLSLPEVTALASRARLFVGNDSGIAHIAAAVSVPSVVIFGSSNVAHWRPWAKSVPAEVVTESLPCAPCPGDLCREFDAPECIRRVKVENVIAAVESVLKQSY